MPGWPTVGRTDDQNLVEALRRADTTAPASLYDSYSERLGDYAHSLLGDREAAAEAVHDALVTAQGRVDRLREPGRLRAWLYALVRVRCAAGARGPRTTTVPPDVHDDPNERELAALVHEAMAELSVQEREVLELSLRHDLGTGEVGAVLGLSSRQVAARLGRARDHLENAAAAVVLAKVGRAHCPDLSAMVDCWEGPLTTMLRRRLSAHIGRCEVCVERRDRHVSAGRLLDLVPLAYPPLSLRRRVIETCVDPRLREARAAVLAENGHFDRAGFPVAAPRRSGGRRWTGRRESTDVPGSTGSRGSRGSRGSHGSRGPDDGRARDEGAHRPGAATPASGIPGSGTPATGTPATGTPAVGALVTEGRFRHAAPAEQDARPWPVEPSGRAWPAEQAESVRPAEPAGRARPAGQGQDPGPGPDPGPDLEAWPSEQSIGAWLAEGDGVTPATEIWHASAGTGQGRAGGTYEPGDAWEDTPAGGTAARRTPGSGSPAGSAGAAVSSGEGRHAGTQAQRRRRRPRRGPLLLAAVCLLAATGAVVVVGGQELTGGAPENPQAAPSTRPALITTEPGPEPTPEPSPETTGEDPQESQEPDEAGPTPTEGPDTAAPAPSATRTAPARRSTAARPRPTRAAPRRPVTGRLVVSCPSDIGQGAGQIRLAARGAALSWSATTSGGLSVQPSRGRLGAGSSGVIWVTASDPSESGSGRVAFRSAGGNTACSISWESPAPEASDPPEDPGPEPTPTASAGTESEVETD
ncbi:sigma-70 family RNA polymerase sigma factor [Streptosporangium sp. NPDC050855]|uniref:sigma-70 family RNA polymerase sigma factor n=1 Tax=Streptosporangium sp. NPDC050855 TaxID=3366194 RepID=UPI0037A6C9F1